MAIKRFWDKCQGFMTKPRAARAAQAAPPPTAALAGLGVGSRAGAWRSRR